MDKSAEDGGLRWWSQSFKGKLEIRGSYHHSLSSSSPERILCFIAEPRRWLAPPPPFPPYLPCMPRFEGETH
ncbi:hypothetical protein FH972_017947 [Carpinus fangiana]|uniref:Uncharacterized protein n=1 Tax=Carpinus fangiana TaxID=176857 RepID=A0A5N6RKG0_9ROSI|nr:hypothetical protein FH972_017947 [Carpinus fangiana]